MPDDLNDFIRNRIRDDLADGTVSDGVITRFPPEPNGYLHIGHAKSICLNFGVANEFGGSTFLRFDDTNPLKESDEYVEAIKRDVAWLGFQWTGDEPTFASNYFRELYDFAEQLIRRGKAYVCSLTAEEIRVTRGTLTTPGQRSPYRDRTVDENLELFRAMRDGRFADGEHVLRAKIDPASPNINMRDPILYRIRHATHHRTGDAWCIYPMYDFTHCICDALEGITHSLCTLEFEDHRPLYDWVLENVDINFHPPQIEFSRLGLEYTVMSKRLFISLVENGHVMGWDDPRMPTIAGLRRRGYRPQAIREFCRRIGVTKSENRVEMELLEFCARQDLEDSTPRGMAVLDPLKVVITNYPEGDPGRPLEGPWHAQQEMGSRILSFSSTLYIEREDFALEPPRKWRRLSPGGMVRLRYAYIIECDEVIEDDAGQVVELRCRYVPTSRSGADTSGLKPKGVIHWVDAETAVPTEIRLFGRLFKDKEPATDDLAASLDPESLVVRHGYIEQAMAASAEERFQFERTGYFMRDTEPGVFNRIVKLRDGWKPNAN